MQSFQKKRMWMRVAVPVFLGLAVLKTAGPILSAPRRAKHVIVVGCDALTPDGIRNSRTPNLDRFLREGAHTFRARAVMPTIGNTNWASMFMGAGPEQHGVTSNKWQPYRPALPPTCTGSGRIFPTIFGLLREQQPSAKIGCFFDWGGFARLVEPKAGNMMYDGKGPHDTMARAILFLLERKPDLTFIQFDHIDRSLHRSGHGSAQYLRAVEEADRLIGQMLNALIAAEMLNETVILVSSDHGGKGKLHGGSSAAEMEIPWIIYGPGTARGKEITAPVDIYDTAATLAYLLGVKTPSCWIGRPVRQAFANF